MARFRPLVCPSHLWCPFSLSSVKHFSLVQGPLAVGGPYVFPETLSGARTQANSREREATALNTFEKISRQTFASYHPHPQTPCFSPPTLLLPHCHLSSQPTRFSNDEKRMRSNHVFLNVVPDRLPGRAVVLVSIDNLVKGASGQAIQNMNVMFGFPETEGIDMAPMFP